MIVYTLPVTDPTTEEIYIPSKKITLREDINSCFDLQVGEAIKKNKFMNIPGTKESCEVTLSDLQEDILKKFYFWDCTRQPNMINATKKDIIHVWERVD